MKKIFLSIFFWTTLFSFAQKKEVCTLEAIIANKKSDTLRILNRSTGKENSKLIADKNGVFKGSISIPEKGIYVLINGKENALFFLKNNYNLKLKTDANNFKDAMVFSGEGANENNILTQYFIKESKYDYNSIMYENESSFNQILNTKNESDLASLQPQKNDPVFVATMTKFIEKNTGDAKKEFEMFLEHNKINGSISPSFEYENYKGGKTKLEDYRGKYVYIDIWATWCGPCRKEIPFLKKAEEKYHDKNIVFLSISVDEQKTHSKWEKLIVDSKLGGVQLFAGNNPEDSFMLNYNVTTIPRFILVDPNGIVVKGGAPVPSSPQLNVLLDSVLN